MLCDKCGAKNLDHKEFCWKCGKPLPKKPADEPSLNVSNASGMIMRFNGQTGQIELFDDKLVIKREGFFAVLTQGLKGEKTIYLDQITGIQLKLGSSFLNGYIQFTLPGGIENRGGIIAASSDENTVQFYKESNDSATKLKEKIEELIKITKQKSNQSINQTIQTSNADEIKKFKQLLDDGIITKDEFDKKKKELLGL